MNVPQITINGKTYKMPKPKINLWRYAVRFAEMQKNGELSSQEEQLDAMIGLVEVAFRNPEVTKEAIEENFDFEELINLITYISQQVSNIAQLKTNQLSQIPNAETPTRT